MAKICPQTGEKVLYLECLECEYKKTCKSIKGNKGNKNEHKY